MTNVDYHKIMLYLADMYKEKQRKIEENKNSSKKDYLLDNDEEYIKYIDIMTSLLPLEFERIIRNDYLQDRKVKWWQEYHTKSTYYRRKHDAVKLFVDCLS